MKWTGFCSTKPCPCLGGLATSHLRRPLPPLDQLSVVPSPLSQAVEPATVGALTSTSLIFVTRRQLPRRKTSSQNHIFELARKQPCTQSNLSMMPSIPPVLNALSASSTAPLYRDAPLGTMYLPALAEDDGLADLPDIGLDTFLQDGLDLCEQQLPFAEANIQLSAQPITKHNIQSMPSLDSAASSSGREAAAANLPSPMIFSHPSALGLEDTSNVPITRSMDDAPSEPSSAPEAAKDASGPDSSGQPRPARRERKRRAGGNSVGTRLAKQREKNRRCQRSFRERQKVKQDALLAELQELRDRCASLEGKLAKAQNPSSK